ncbi:MAG: hypothetical protein ACAH65_07715 [Chloroflexota bacterium]
MTNSVRVSRASRAASVAGAAGLISTVMTALYFTVGQPFGTLNDIALLVMTLALAPVMLGFYELGGRTPLLPARLALASGIGAIVTWSIAQLVFISQFTFDYQHPVTGALAVEAVMLIAIGSWLTGAPLLAGPWLTMPLRWLGAVCGVAFVLLGAGLLIGGGFHPLSLVGGLVYQLAFPVWALLIGRLLARRAVPA